LLPTNQQDKNSAKIDENRDAFNKNAKVFMPESSQIKIKPIEIERLMIKNEIHIFTLTAEANQVAMSLNQTGDMADQPMNIKRHRFLAEIVLDRLAELLAHPLHHSGLRLKIFFGIDLRQATKRDKK
jgi:hypothetical protein